MRAKLRSLLTEVEAVLLEDGGWAGMYATQHLGAGPQAASQEAWPYRTQAAHAVWSAAKDLISLYPERSTQEVLMLAVREASVAASDLTPEDWRLLEMAVEWYRDGTTGIPKPAAGGNPGSSSTTGHR